MYLTVTYIDCISRPGLVTAEVYVYGSMPLRITERYRILVYIRIRYLLKGIGRLLYTSV